MREAAPPPVRLEANVGVVGHAFAFPKPCSQSRGFALQRRDVRPKFLPSGAYSPHQKRNPDQ
jgi:hypothetical protein